MPSSPNGPCSTGNATSTPSSPRPGSTAKVAAVAAPDAVAADLDLDRHVASLLEARPDGCGRGERNFVLGGSASAEHRDADGAHGVGVVVAPLVGVVDVVEVVPGPPVVVVVVGVGAT